MALTKEQIQLVQNSFQKVAVISDEAAKIFYARLFEIAPETKSLFADTSMQEQRAKLMQTIGTAVGSLRNLEAIVPAVKELGKRHVKYNVKAEHYAPVGEALLYALEQGLGDDFTPETKTAWAAVYNLLAATAIEGAKEVSEDYE